MGYRLLTQRLVGDRIVMRYRGRTRDGRHRRRLAPAAAERRRPRSAACATSSRRSTPATSRPGRCAITLLIPSPAASLARESCAAGARRPARATSRGASTASRSPGRPLSIGRAAVRSSLVLPAALAGGQRRGRGRRRGACCAPGTSPPRGRQRRAAASIADVGIAEPAVAPVAVALRRHGALVGTGAARGAERERLRRRLLLPDRRRRARPRRRPPARRAHRAGRRRCRRAARCAGTGAAYHVASFTATALPVGRGDRLPAGARLTAASPAPLAVARRPVAPPHPLEQRLAAHRHRDDVRGRDQVLVQRMPRRGRRRGRCRPAGSRRARCGACRACGRR